MISQRTHRIVRVIPTGYLSQHVVPSYDLQDADHELQLTPTSWSRIDPRTGRRVRTISMPRPYNLYFTPDGKTAVVMIEQYDTIRFAEPAHLAHDRRT